MGGVVVLLILLAIFALIFVVALCYGIPQLLQCILMRTMKTERVPKPKKGAVSDDGADN